MTLIALIVFLVVFAAVAALGIVSAITMTRKDGYGSRTTYRA
ncbi:hypothetical protein VD659_05380 [Herbiconiux sp. 11R-BC]